MAVLEAEATLTERYQNTVPAPIRRALGLHGHDKIVYVLQEDGSVVVRKKEVPGDDPALAPFLDFLERDIAARPERLQAVTGAVHERIRDLVGDVEVDLDRQLADDDDV